MYLFVQIERALLREGLEADGALEGPLACRAGGTEKQNKTTMDTVHSAGSGTRSSHRARSHTTMRES